MKLRTVFSTFILCIFEFKQLKATESNCGKRLLTHNPLITGGIEANKNSWPWHAAIFHVIRSNIAYKCGGTVLNSNSVLTAAHCVFENDQTIATNRVLVHLGKHKLRVFESGTQEFQVFNIIVHSHYNESDYSNDIAIIRLSTEAIFNNFVQPICLWDPSKVHISNIFGKLGTVVGWGFTEKNKLSPILLEAQMPVVPHSICLLSNRNYFGSFLSNKNFCAGFRNGTGVCNGDSGGSISFQENDVYYIRGIVSTTVSRGEDGLCDTKEYVIFTDVTQYLPWIEKVVPELKRSESELDAAPKSSYINGKRFVLFLTKNNWYRAAHICAYYQMQIATINNIEEHNVAVELIRPHIRLQSDGANRVWIGGNDLGEIHHWYWQSTGLPIKFFHWANGEPNNNGRNGRCIILEYFGNLQWNDWECYYEANFLCEEISMQM
ncbi:hypothetical protein HA402_015004 [Bradysia odoriphaga]|nr:hypothetical protein HA402_015004 [Bradysia odoriphaga]